MREMKDSGVPWIGEIPKGVNLDKLKYLVSFEKGKLPNEINTEGRGAPYIGASEMNGAIPKLFTTSTIPLCKEDDVLILWDGANAGLVSTNHIGAVSSTVCRARNCSKSDSRYLFYCIKNAERYYRDMVTGTTIPHMSSAYLDDTYILRFPYEEQRCIADFLDTKCVEIDSFLEQTKASIEEYKKLKQSVITEAVTKGIRGVRPMKDSGVEWIGDIPDKWQIGSLKRLLSGVQDGTHATLVRVDKGYPLLSAKNVQDGKLIIKDNESCISESDYQSIIANGYPRKGDILFCCIGGSIGKCCMYEYDRPMAFQRSVTFLRSSNQAHNLFIYYLLLSDICIPQYKLLSNTSAQAGIYMSSLREILIPIPGLTEQQEIAAYLDEKCAAIDSLIASKEALITELEAYKKSIIYEYVTGKKEVR